MSLIKLQRLQNCDLPLPEYQTKGAAGFDLQAYLDTKDMLGMGNCVIPGMMYAIISTGFNVEIDKGYELQIRSRSGLAARHGLFVLNAPGTIDSDYRGEIKVILANFSSYDYTVRHGDRIAQAVLCPVVQAQIKEVESLSLTDRGQGGFGSTGL